MSRSEYTDIHGNIQFINGKDFSPTAAMVQQCINQVSAEILRMAKLPYASVNDRHKMMYLDELLAAYERDLKTFI